MSDLLGKDINELKSLVSDLGLPLFTATQIAQWLYKKRATSIDQFTNLALSARQKLSQICQVGRTQPVHEMRSKDGTVKYLFSTAHGDVETVYIPDGERATLCVSSQVGCKMNCHFCATGHMGFHGNLTASEILNQILSIPQFDTLTNVVFMGMGEPMDNYENVMRALDVLTSEKYGLGWSPKRITVSSVGVLPKVEQFLHESQCHLAISLHNPFGNEREEMMPVQKAYPAHQLIEMLRGYDFSHQRRLSFEYTLIDGWNDTTRHAAALARMLKGMDCRVNLIKYHDSHSESRASQQQTIQQFEDFLNAHGIKTTIRRSRGEDIDAACGLLATSVQQGAKGGA